MFREKNAKNFQDSSTTVLKDSTNSHALLVSDQDDNNNPLAKKRWLSNPEIEDLIKGAELMDRPRNLAQKIYKSSFHI